jgi:hypothetical protein
MRARILVEAGGEWAEGAKRGMTADELRARLSVAESRRDALRSELRGLVARYPEIRATFGNPFSYSRPKNDNEGEANFTGHSSHDVVLPTALELRRVEREIERLKAELGALGL